MMSTGKHGRRYRQSKSSCWREWNRHTKAMKTVPTIVVHHSAQLELIVPRNADTTATSHPTYTGAKNAKFATSCPALKSADQNVKNDRMRSRFNQTKSKKPCGGEWNVSGRPKTTTPWPY